MESDKIEQAAGADCAEAPENLPTEAVSMKFKNVGELWRAYRNLEAEFTKKCQKLSELGRGKASAGEGEDAGRGKPSAGVPAPREGETETQGSLQANRTVRGEEGAGAPRDLLGKESGLAEDRREGFPESERSAGVSVFDRAYGESRVIASPSRKPSSLSEAGDLFLKDLNRSIRR